MGTNWVSVNIGSRPSTLSASGMIEIDESAMRIVYPSGFARATYCMPTPPPAPERFSTTTGCFRMRVIASASGRPVMSATPPGGNGTTIAMALAG